MKSAVLALALVCALPGLALAQQGDSYRETRLGLYASAREASCDA